MGKQELSTVEHEFLHALGFWHEQSRFDRDDYVTIMWNQIKVGAGFFMHFSTATGTRGDTAYLESRLFYPKRRSQCLQFYHYNSGGADDQLNIWVREYTAENPKGALRLIQKISGGHQGSWELYHVTLDVSDKFRVVFERVKGRGPSAGGLSLDDINLAETKCPQYTWHIRNFTSLLATTHAGYKTYSPRYLSPDGYSFQIGLYINGVTDSPNKMAVYFHLTSGPYDDKLQWPCPWRQASMELMDQNPDIQHRMNNIRMITTDPHKTSTDSKGNVEYFWDNPRKVGSLVTDSNGSKYYRGPGYGYKSYITHDHLKSRSFIKGDDVFLFSLNDVTRLLESEIRDLRLETDDRNAEKEPKRQMWNTKIDVDDGKDQNIFDINGEAGLHLVEGDILIQEGEDRNTILDEKYRWPTAVPYVLDRSLGL
ncbi:meprin A subunit beta-like protein [Labeo rohita]|uniref:Meprin A subunit beta-like protein n=1 Tax=Labeo rohita TaxID=84645 RepID=A0A498P285_LABRO|nr:meprin A subunit beta-like protein [Labeo rohita]